MMLINGIGNTHTQYLAKLSNKSKLFGHDGSLEQEARVVSWMSWANQELLPTLALWYVNPPFSPRPRRTIIRFSFFSGRGGGYWEGTYIFEKKWEGGLF